MNEQLSWRRVGWLLRNDFVASYRSWLTASAVIAGIMALAALLGANQGEGETYLGWFIGTLLVWGTIMSSLSFTELHDKNKNIAYLTLPASALEKTIAPLLVSTVGLIAYLLVFMTLASVAIEAINVAVVAGRHQPFDPFSPWVWLVIPHYIVLQSLFFAGGAWFRRARYLLTGLAVLGVCFGLWVVLAFALWLTGAVQIVGAGIDIQADIGFWLDQADGRLVAALEVLFKIAYFAVLPLFCWYLAWLRLTETEVSHGV